MEGVATDGEKSPPYKWPKLSTPPSRRHSLFNESADSGLEVSFSSPPTSKISKKPSPLRTPRTNSLYSHNTTSPFRCFRRSSFASPTVSGKALKLSNTENTIGVRFCEGKMTKGHGELDIVRMASTNTAARCLELTLPVPSAPKVETDIDESPNKYFNIMNDSGMFADEFSLFSVPDSPLKTLDNVCVSLETQENDPYLGVATTSSASTRDIDIKTQKKSNGSCLNGKRELFDESTTNDTSLLKSDDLFSSPKKPLKPFSSKWMQLVTGSTPTQRDMTTAAHAYLISRTGAKYQNKITS